ncbi:hypothetical protein TrLO_g12393 [Triparma laevis f. longispina]|uniref:TNFR-Cys domain-containing protein n=1 Tax=Triparma laevis f. longispina TaxID=1714387 RepID=A0A9W7FRP3_9STRA|nr:hypothetical protein TrLO_g12393 [Triparma laevis f. longispina]
MKVEQQDGKGLWGSAPPSLTSSTRQARAGSRPAKNPTGSRDAPTRARAARGYFNFLNVFTFIALILLQSRGVLASSNSSYPAPSIVALSELGEAQTQRHLTHTYTLITRDSWGDGWNGGRLDITNSAGQVINSNGPSSGCDWSPCQRSESISLTCGSHTAVISQTYGWAGERSWLIKNSYGTTVASGSVNSADSFTVPCDDDESSPEPPAPCDGAETYTIITRDTYGDTWNGGVLRVRNTATNAIITTSYGTSSGCKWGSCQRTETFPICCGSYSAQQSGSSWNSEIIWIIRDSSGSQVASATSTGTDYFSIACAPPPPPEPPPAAVGNAVIFRVTSKGWYDTQQSYARFYVNNQLGHTGSNGFNLVKLTTGSGGFEMTALATGLNMYTSPSSSSQNLYNVINALPEDTMVCASVADTGSGITSTGISGLQMIGGQATSFPFRHSYILCGKKGASSPIFEQTPAAEPFDNTLLICDNYSTLTVSATCTPDSDGAAVPQYCPAGSSNPSGGSDADSCVNCAAGKHSSAGTCTPCAAGKYLVDSTTSPESSACLSCSPGSYSSSSSETCTICVTGKYAVDPNHVLDVEEVCQICPAGSFSDTQSATSCTTCPAGTYNADAGTSSVHHDSLLDCVVCQAGKYLPDAGTDRIHHDSEEKCFVCPSGTYLSDDGAVASNHVACTTCPFGKHNDDDGDKHTSHNGPEDCRLCAPGKYSKDSNGAQHCTSCENGETSGAGAEGCSSCNAGWVCNEDGTTVPCEPGEYSQDSPCLPCTPGYKCPGAMDRVLCPPGSSQPNGNENSCVPCVAGKFQPDSGKTFCLECTQGHFCPKASTAPIPCGSASLYCPTSSEIVQAATAGSYTLPATEETTAVRNGQQPCEAGYACVGGIKTSCVAGSTFQTQTGQTTCQSCAVCGAGKFIASTCTTTSNTDCEDCAMGTFINTASTSISDTECEECPLGKISMADRSACEECDREGEYSDSSRASFCKTAAAGFKPSANRQTVEPCPVGKFSRGGNDDCTDCDVDQGFVAPTQQRASCDYCGAGKYASTSTNACELCPPSEYSVGGASSCLSCDVNTYTDTNGATVCDYCDPGQIPHTNQQSCVLCDAGKTASIGDVGCELCPAGLYSGSGSGVCLYCDPGTYSNEGSSSCISCAGGKVSSNGAASCSNCVAGTYDDGNNVCHPCNAGSFSEAGSTSCDSSCPAGTYGRIGEATCNDCEAGKFAALGAASCELCEAGTWSGAKAGECVHCAPGKVSSMGAVSCTPCEAGFYSPEKAPGCTMCTSGKYSGDEAGECGVCIAGKMSGTGASSCAVCAAGKYSQLVSEDPPQGASQCTDCDAGKFSAEGSGSCAGSCEAGTFGGPGSSVCEDCNAGTYSGAGASMCINCVGGTYSGARAPECDSCPAGKFSSNAASECATCNAGLGYVSGPGQSQCSYCGAGKLADSSSNTCIDCEKGKSSTGGSDTCGNCETGRRSDAGASSCNTCEPGEIPIDELCTKCSKGMYAEFSATECSECNGLGQYSDDDGAAVCSNAPGGYKPNADRTDVTPCPPGRFSIGGATDCSTCVAGEFTSSEGAVGCTKASTCGAGRYIKTPSSPTADTECEDCAIGKASIGNKNSCDDCDVEGEYADASAMSSCKNAVAGTYPVLNRQDFELCPVGKFSPGGNNVCSECNAAEGYVAPNLGQASCDYCEAGKFASITSSTCENCQKGKYSIGGSSTCLPCAVETYTDENGATVCDFCDAGQVPSAYRQSCVVCEGGKFAGIGNVVCELCNAGLYSPSGAGVCSYCEPGTYSEEGSFECTSCPGGKVSSIGAAFCDDCVASTYDDGNNLCQPCRAGTLSDAGSTECNSDCPAGTRGKKGEATCIGCEAGKYSEAGADACENCQGGTYSSARAGACTDCDAGKYSGVSSHDCDTCDAGFFSHQKAQGCDQCGSGKYSGDGTGSCTVCEAGKWSHNGAPACAICERGTYSQVTCESEICVGASHCTDCESGKYSSAGSASCHGECEAGTYSNIAAHACNDCSPGRYSDTGASTCIICLGGKFSDAKAGSCETCAAGKFSSNAASECENCLSGQGYGKYAPSPGAVGCIAASTCSAGMYARNPSTPTTDTVCENCIKGKASSGSQTSCVACNDSGQYADAPKSAHCMVAPAGYSPATNRKSKVACPVGKYSTGGSDYCSECVAALGYVASTPGRSSCQFCGAGKYASVATNNCEPCAASFYSVGGVISCPKCAPGTYTGSSGSSVCNFCHAGQIPNADQTYCTNCNAGTYSSKGNVVCEECEEGLYSASGAGTCSYCVAGMFSMGGAASCELCPPGKVSSNGAASCDNCEAGKYDDGGNICQSCDAGKLSAAGSTSCDSDCPPGTYGESEGSVICLECDAGKFSTTGSDFCQNCVEGKFSEIAAGECSTCVAGKASSAGSAGCEVCAGGQFAIEESSYCSTCVPGRYSGEEAGECTLCSAGKKSANEASECIACAAGKKSEFEEGSSHCLECPAGTYSSVGSSSCHGECEAGTFSVVGSHSCTDCPPGKFSEAGSHLCSDCDGGTYSGSKAGSCLSCEAGKHSGVGATACDDCDATKGEVSGVGKYGSTDKKSCTSCEKGEYSAIASYEQCNNCEAGKYSNSTETEVCSRCLDHQTSDEGSSECRCANTFVEYDDKCTCRPGTTKEHGICVDCANGYFKPTYGTGECSSCDKSAVKGAIQSKTPFDSKFSCECSIGEFWLDEEPEVNNNGLKAHCHKCPDGVDCSKSGSTIGELNVLPGYWRSANNSFKVEKCYNKLACQKDEGGENANKTGSGDYYCTDGHTGPLCNICKDDFVMSVTGECDQCNMDLKVPYQLIIFGVLIVLIIVAIFAYRRYSKNRKRSPSGNQVTTTGRFRRASLTPNRTRRSSTVEMRGGAPSIEMDDIKGAKQTKTRNKRASTVANREAFDEERKKDTMFSRFRTKFKILTSFYQIVSQYEHVLEIRFPEVFENFGRWVSSIANLDALKLVQFGCIMKTDYHLKLLFSTLTPIILSFGIVLYYYAKRSRISAEKHEAHLDFCWTAFLTLTYLVFASVSTTLFKTFQCKQYGDDPNEYLVDDYQVNCASPEHKLAELYACFMMVVYPFGTTALYFVLLRKHRHQLQDEERYLEKNKKSLNYIAFLWEMYEPRMWWFEIFECVRRLSMTGMLVFVSPGSPTQIVIAILNSIVSIVMYSHLLPFEKDSDDNLAVVSNWSIFFTLFGALMVKTEVDQTENFNEKQIFGYLLIFVNVAGLGLIAAELAVIPCSYILRRLKAKLKHNGKLKGLTEEHLFSPGLYWTYVEKLLKSDEYEAGWSLIEPELKDEDYSAWVSFIGAGTQWRCSDGDGPVDQIRATFIVDAECKKVCAYLVNKENVQDKDTESGRNILTPYHEKELKGRYYVAKKMPFPFYDRDFMFEEWSGECADGEGKMIIARSYIDERRESQKSSSNLRRKRAKIAIYAFLLKPTRSGGQLATEVTFVGGGFDLKGILATDLHGREVYLRMMERVVNELDWKFNEYEGGMNVSKSFVLRKGHHRSRKTQGKRMSGSVKNLGSGRGGTMNALVVNANRGGGVVMGGGGGVRAKVQANDKGLLAFGRGGAGGAGESGKKKAPAPVIDWKDSDPPAAEKEEDEIICSTPNCGGMEGCAVDEGNQKVYCAKCWAQWDGGGKPSGNIEESRVGERTAGSRRQSEFDKSLGFFKKKEEEGGGNFTAVMGVKKAAKKFNSLQATERNDDL